MTNKNPLRKNSIVDVRCRDRRGRQFIVEMQMAWSPEFQQRVLFNAAKAYVRQLDKEKITSEDFDTYAYPLIDLGWLFDEYFSTKLYTSTEWMKHKGTLFFKNVELDGIEL